MTRAEALKKKKRRKIGTIVYTVCLLLYIAALIAAAVYGLKIVWRYAEEYEAARPNNTMDAYLEDLNDDFWNGSMADTVAAMPHEMQTDEECREFIKTMLDGGIRYTRGAGDTADSSRLVYSIRCDSGVFGTVTLEEDQSYADKVEFGMLPWKIVDEEFDFNGLYTKIKITVPSTYKVELNGHILGSEYITEEGIHLDLLDAYYDEYPNLPTKVTYEFDHIIGYIEPVVLNENGEVVDFDKNADDSQYVKYADEATVARLADFTARFEERYRHFSAGCQYMTYYDKLLSYIIKGGDLDQRFQKAFDGLSWAHTNSVEVYSTTVSSVIEIDDKTWIVEETTCATAYGPSTEYSETTMQLVVVEVSPGDLRIIAMN